jgi:hypothetical protein
MPKVELLPVTYDPERLLMWADENFRRISDTVNNLGSAAPGGLTVLAANVSAGTFGANVGNGDYTFPGQVFVATKLRIGDSPGGAYGNPYISVDVTSRSYTVAGNYVILADYLNTFVNAPTGGNVFCRVNNNDRLTVSNTTVGHPSCDTYIDWQKSHYIRGIDANHRLWVPAIVGGYGPWNQDGAVLNGWATLTLWNGGYAAGMQMLGGGALYCQGDVHGSYGVFGEEWIGTWAGGHGTVGRNGTLSLGGNPLGYMMRNDGNCWIGVSGPLNFRMDGSDIMYVANSGGWNDFRPNLYNNLSGSTVQRSGTNQLGYVASRSEVKENITKMRLGRDNPLFKVTPRRFHWDEYVVVGGKEHNEHAPDGIAGVLIEELAPLAPDACHPNVLDGKPAHLDERVLIGYLIECVQTLASEIDDLKKVGKN